MWAEVTWEIASWPRTSHSSIPLPSSLKEVQRIHPPKNWAHYVFHWCSLWLDQYLSMHKGWLVGWLVCRYFRYWFELEMVLKIPYKEDISLFQGNIHVWLHFPRDQGLLPLLLSPMSFTNQSQRNSALQPPHCGSSSFQGISSTCAGSLLGSKSTGPTFL